MQVQPSQSFHNGIALNGQKYEDVDFMWIFFLKLNKICMKTVV